MEDTISVEEPSEDYRAKKDWISRSDLANIGICPAYYKWRTENEVAATPALIFGSAFHKYILEKSDFKNSYAIQLNVDRRTKEGKAASIQFEIENAGKTIISQDDFLKMQDMEKSLLSNELAKKALSDNCNEKSIYYVDQDTGLKCKVRPDSVKIIYNDDKSIKSIICNDLKTCTNGDLHSIIHDVRDRYYDLQAYMYRKALSYLYHISEDKISFVFIFIEKAEPYLVDMVSCGDTVFEAGKYRFIELARIYQECLKNNDWYGYAGKNEIQDLNYPDYMLERN